MCWEKDVNVLKDWYKGLKIGAQRSDNVLGKRRECALNSGICAQGNRYVLKGVTMCWEKDVNVFKDVVYVLKVIDMCSQ
jgi:hypothetical protein